MPKTDKAAVDTAAAETAAPVDATPDKALEERLALVEAKLDWLASVYSWPTNPSSTWAW